jgi:hypothetical protein
MCMLAKDEKRAKTAKPCAMQRIGEWLASLGLSEYAQRFSENDIDVSVLRHLTDQDLKELARCWRRLPSRRRSSDTSDRRFPRADITG